MTDGRDAALSLFIRNAGWTGAEIAPLAGDASNRRYHRLHRTEQTAVLMDAPPARGEDVRPFVAMTEWLRAAGLSAPAILAADLDLGFLLLEDLGDRLYARHLNDRPGDEPLLYGRAVDLLADLAGLSVPRVIGTGAARVAVAPYDRATLERESGLLGEWWLPAAAGRPVPGRSPAEFVALVRDATARVEPARDVMVLRDYHAENLVWLPGRPGHAAVGLLDYQDALAGHPAYDLVSLLEDARRDTPPELRGAMVDAYLARRPDLDREAFGAACAALGAQRNLKIIGIFTRLAVRDGKPAYLALIPRVWGHLQRDLAHHALAPLSEWVRRHVPAPEPAVLDSVARLVRA